jgi:outer membrane protein assembly factor BamD
LGLPFFSAKAQPSGPEVHLEIKLLVVPTPIYNFAVMVKQFFGALLLCGLLGSCSKFQRVIKHEDWRVRYDAAMTYYEKKQDYYRAGVLLEDLIPILRGTPEAEKAQFYWAYCYFKQQQYETSSSYFKSFHDTYNRSQFAEESLFMHCYSLYQASPPVNLDQTSTNTAIDAFQEFINRYPSSSYAKQSAALILDLRAKLEEKAYTSARFYQKVQNYKSAVIVYENFQRDFPDSKYQEEVAFRRLEAQYDLARNSYDYKKKERFNQAIDFYQLFLDKYPQSVFLRPAEDMFETSQKQLRFISKEEKRLAELAVPATSAQGKE